MSFVHGANSWNADCLNWKGLMTCFFMKRVKFQCTVQDNFKRLPNDKKAFKFAKLSFLTASNVFSTVNLSTLLRRSSTSSSLLAQWKDYFNKFANNLNQHFSSFFGTCWIVIMFQNKLFQSYNPIHLSSQTLSYFHEIILLFLQNKHLTNWHQ